MVKDFIKRIKVFCIKKENLCFLYNTSRNKIKIIIKKFKLVLITL